MAQPCSFTQPSTSAIHTFPSSMRAPVNAIAQKRALLIGIRNVVGPQFSNLDRLDFAHRDAKALRDQLIESYGYCPEDITLMIDRKEHPRHLWPTRHNILDQIDRITRDVPEGSHIFFYYSGHGLQEVCHECAMVRVNGQDDEIISADGKPILDHILHDRIITPLENVKRSKLFALFDCCHSETLLDLQRGRGQNPSSRVWHIGRDHRFRAISLILTTFLDLNKRHQKDDPLRPPRQKSIYLNNNPVFEDQEIEGLSIICLSACRDWQSAHDDPVSKLTFSKCFIDAMAQKPAMAWIELLDALHEFISHLHTKYGSLHWQQDPRISTNFHLDRNQAVMNGIV